MTTSRTTSGSFLPQWLGEFYSKFPLVVLDQEDSVTTLRDVPTSQSSYSLWVHAPSSSSASYRWASSDPQSLRSQLLFLLEPRAPLVDFHPFSRKDNAPGGELPCLELRAERRLIAASELRTWFDARFSPPGAKELQGMPDRATYDLAIAVARLVQDKIYPAYLASLPGNPPSHLHPLLPFAPPLAAGLVTPLPASLTGDVRTLDHERILSEGESALDALDELLSEGLWGLGARSPTPLDSLVASHLHCLYELPEESRLRRRLEDSSTLPRYVIKVMDQASQRMSRTRV